MAGWRDVPEAYGFKVGDRIHHRRFGKAGTVSRIQYGSFSSRYSGNSMDVKWDDGEETKGLDMGTHHDKYQGFDHEKKSESLEFAAGDKVQTPKGPGKILDQGLVDDQMQYQVELPDGSKEWYSLGKLEPAEEGRFNVGDEVHTSDGNTGVVVKQLDSGIYRVKLDTLDHDTRSFFGHELRSSVEGVAYDTVRGWQLPTPNDWITAVEMGQDPDAVANDMEHCGVPHKKSKKVGRNKVGTVQEGLNDPTGALYPGAIVRLLRPIPLPGNRFTRANSVGTVVSVIDGTVEAYVGGERVRISAEDVQIQGPRGQMSKLPSSMRSVPARMIDSVEAGIDAAIVLEMFEDDQGPAVSYTSPGPSMGLPGGAGGYVTKARIHTATREGHLTVTPVDKNGDYDARGIENFDRGAEVRIRTDDGYEASGKVHQAGSAIKLAFLGREHEHLGSKYRGQVVTLSTGMDQP